MTPLVLGEDNYRPEVTAARLYRLKSFWAAFHGISLSRTWCKLSAPLVLSRLNGRAKSFHRCPKATFTLFSNMRNKFEACSCRAPKILGPVVAAPGITRSPRSACGTRKCRSFLGSLPIRLLSDARPRDSIREKPSLSVLSTECLALKPLPTFFKTCSKESCTLVSIPTNTSIRSVQVASFLTTTTLT